MREPHLRPEDGDPGLLRGHRGRLRDPQGGRRPPQPLRPARVVRRSQQQQRPGGGGKLSDASGERLLQPVTDRQRLRQGRPPGQLVRAQVARGVEQGQRVAPGLGRRAAPSPRRRPAGRSGPPGARRRGGRTGRPAGSRAAPAVAPARRLLRRDDHGDGVGQEAARHEAEDGRRLVVEPLRVVDHAQQGLLSAACDSRVRTARPTRNGSAGGPLSSPNATCRARFCGSGSRSAAVQEGEEQLVHAGEGQRPLRLDGHHADDLHVGCGVDGVLEEGGLAGTRVAPDDHRTAEPGPHAVKDLADHLRLCAAVDQAGTRRTIAPGSLLGRRRGNRASKRGADRPQVQVAVDAAQLFARCDHAGDAPAQRQGASA